MLLTNAVDAAGRPVELYAKEGKIAAVGQGLAALADPEDLVLDAGGLTVLPAFVDLHCHWRTPGFEYKEDIATGQCCRSRWRIYLCQPDAQHKAGMFLGSAGCTGRAGGRTAWRVRCKPDRLDHREL